MAPNQLSAPVRSVASEPLFAWAMAIACDSSAFAWNTKDEATLLFHCWRSALLAEVLNDCRLLCCSDSADVRAFSSLAPSCCCSSPAVRMPRCWEASSFIRETSPSTRMA